MKLRPSLKTLAPALMVLAVAASPAYAQDGATRDDSTLRPQDDSARERAQESVARSNTRVNTDAARGGALNDGQILQVVRTLNDAEIKQAEEAKDEGESQVVKDFAEMIITDHEASNEKMDTVLDGPLNLEDSPLSDTLGKQGEETHELLQDLAGAEYDCAYLQQQVTQHEAAIELSRSQLMPNAQEQSVKDYLAGKGPTLEHHLQLAKDALGKVEGCSAAN